MNIIYLAAGAGQMHCGACARDIALVRGLIRRGHDVQVIPLYTPLKLEGDAPVPVAPVFLGGINAYLQQKSRFFRRLPPALDRILDSRRLLNYVSRFAISTRASELGEMTVSVLAGADGLQKKELRRLIDHLKSQGAPDAFVITNTLLSGLAPELKRHFSVPVLCGLQGEDDFVRSMLPVHQERALELMHQNAAEIDLFIAPGPWYAELMADFLRIPPQSIRIVRTALDVDSYAWEGPRPREPFTLGYLSVIAPRKGLDILVEAFGVLVREQGRDVRLRVAGRVLSDDFFRSLQAKIGHWKLSDRFEHLGEVDMASKQQFLRSCSAFCLPSRFPETRALAVMEALAAGVPVVVPATGTFPELLERVGGGLLFPSGDADALAAQVARLHDDPQVADEMGRSAAKAISEHHNVDLAVDEMLAVLREVVG
jgi:glycosyltransferase involved in cell wall biosynthesis